MHILDISLETSLTPDDIIATLQRNDMILFQNNQYILSIDEKKMRRQVDNIESNQSLKLDPGKLKWVPFLSI